MATWQGFRYVGCNSAPTDPQPSCCMSAKSSFLTFVWVTPIFYSVKSSGHHHEWTPSYDTDTPQHSPHLSYLGIAVCKSVLSPHGCGYLHTLKQVISFSDLYVRGKRRTPETLLC